MTQPIATIHTESGVTLRIERLPQVSIRLPAEPLDEAGAQRLTVEVAGKIEAHLVTWLNDSLPEPRPLRKTVRHDDKGRIIEVLERAADPGKLATARSITAELMRQVYLPALLQQISASA